MLGHKKEKKELNFIINLAKIGLDLPSIPIKLKKYIKAKYKSKYFLDIIETDKNDNYIFKYKLEP